MADFRKWLLALAAVAVLLSLGSSSAYAQGAFTCVSNAGAPNIVRGEGVAELVGDIILNCTGGQPTTGGKSIPLSNVQVSLNTNITSRIISNTTGASEALILIDEPFPQIEGDASPTVAQGGPAYNGTQPPAQLACFADNNTNCKVISVGVGVGALGSYSGFTNNTFAPGPHYNIFQGFQSNASTIAWQGVPIDAPGTAGTRVIRITNIRANACLLGVSSTFIPTQIIAQIGVNGGATITINNPSQVVALAERGMITSNGTSTYTQCVDVNDFLINSLPGTPVPVGTLPFGPFSVTATEGFGYSFKPRNYNQILSGLGLGSGTNGTADPDSDVGLQNIPGFTYRTESGFIPGTGIAGASGAYNSGGGTVGSVGLASQGTEISVAFAGVQAGVSLYVPGAITLAGNYGLGTPFGYAQLIGGDGTGNPNALTVSGTTAVATYEILYSDPSVTETMTVPVYVAYISNTAQNLPGPGTATVAVNFAPLSTSPTASSSAPIPRFCQPYTPANLYTIAPCTCNLLFPFVTNQSGFDTGVAIANTSADTLNGVTPQQGLVTLTYYGNTTGGGAAPPTAVTTSQVPAGAELLFTLSGGGNYGIPATPGFQGYIIAQADFQWCHGFAFISDAGAQKFAEGYLAIQLDIPILNRTGVPGENEGH
jgi:large repetitive protein